MWSQKFDIKLYDYKLSTAFSRTSFGYSWAPGMAGAQNPYLCSHDMDELKSAINGLCRYIRWLTKD